MIYELLSLALEYVLLGSYSFKYLGSFTEYSNHFSFPLKNVF